MKEREEVIKEAVKTELRPSLMILVKISRMVGALGFRVKTSV